MNKYDRLCVLPIDVVLLAIKKGSARENYASGWKVPGHSEVVSVNSERLKTYLKGISCVSCKKVAYFFAVEKNAIQSGRYHLNLYHKEGGVEVMMTSDHIVAKSRGGSNKVANRQPMCFQCNNIKGPYDSVEEGEKIRKKERYRQNELKLEKAIISISHCESMLSAGDSSKDWKKLLNKHTTFRNKMKNKIRKELNEPEQFEVTNGSNGVSKPGEPLHSTVPEGGERPGNGGRDTSFTWWGLIKKAFPNTFKTSFGWK